MFQKNMMPPSYGLFQSVDPAYGASRKMWRQSFREFDSEITIRNYFVFWPCLSVHCSALLVSNFPSQISAHVGDNSFDFVEQFFAADVAETVFAPPMNLHSDFVAKLAECLLGCGEQCAANAIVACQSYGYFAVAGHWGAGDVLRSHCVSGCFCRGVYVDGSGSENTISKPFSRNFSGSDAPSG